MVKYICMFSNIVVKVVENIKGFELCSCVNTRFCFNFFYQNI